jgi:transposase-like protein
VLIMTKARPYSLALVRAILEDSLQPGCTIKQACQDHGVGHATFYRWTRHYPEAGALAAEVRERRTIHLGGTNGGRNPEIAPEVIEHIIHLVETEGLTVRQAAQRLGMQPGTAWDAIHRRGLYDRVREAQRRGAHPMAEATLEILDDDSGDLIEQPDGRYTVNTARVRRDQARAAQRLTLAARYAPDSYGKQEPGRTPRITINIDADKLARIREVSESTLAAIEGRIAQDKIADCGS